VNVGGGGDLEVPLLARHHVDGHLGQVAQDDRAVVGGLEGRVLPGPGVGIADHREAEGLRGLDPAQLGPGWDCADDVAGADLDDRVGGGGRDSHRRSGVERPVAVGDDPLGDEGAHRVVEEHLAVGVGDGGQRPEGRRAAGRAALQHVGDLGEPGAAHDGPDGVEVAGGHQHDELVDVGMRVEDRHGVLDDRPPGNLDQLLGNLRTQPGADPAGEEHRDVVAPLGS